MKKLIFILIGFLMAENLFSQNLMVVYERKLNFSRRNYILFVNDTLSYWQFTQRLEDIDTTLVLKNGMEFNSFNVIRIESPEYKAYKYKNFILKDRKNKQVYYVDHSMKTPDDQYTYVKDSLFPMKWTPNYDHVFILGYICNSAKTYFRGRTYVAYYTPEIPYPEGPWKFGGLPGLILKVVDQSGEFSWTAKKIVKNYKNVPEMPDLSEYDFISWNEFVKRYREKMDKRTAERRAERMRKGITSYGNVRVIQEEILHPVNTPAGIDYGIKSDGDEEQSNKSKKKRNRSRKKKKKNK